MGQKLPFIILSLLILLGACHLWVPVASAESQQVDDQVVELTDDNFDSKTWSGVWMIDIYATWCSHCQALEPTWQQLAKEAAKHGIHVGKVNGPQNRVLTMRFNIQGYPSIFLLKDGKAWTFDDARSLHRLMDFAIKGHKSKSPMRWHRAPNSSFGRLMGLLHSFPAFAGRGYKFLRHEKGFSDGSIITAVLAIPLALGAAAICLLDAIYSRRPGLELRGIAGEEQHAHAD